jgi:hypothetical protein
MLEAWRARCPGQPHALHTIATCLSSHFTRRTPRTTVKHHSISAVLVHQSHGQCQGPCAARQVRDQSSNGSPQVQTALTLAEEASADAAAVPWLCAKPGSLAGLDSLCTGAYALEWSHMVATAGTRRQARHWSGPKQRYETTYVLQKH